MTGLNQIDKILDRAKKATIEYQNLTGKPSRITSEISEYEADRLVLKQALKKPGSKARNDRGALAVSKFKSISKLVWSKPSDAA